MPGQRQGRLLGPDGRPTDLEAGLRRRGLRGRLLIDDEPVLAKCGWTPYDGFEATGWPVATIIRGQFVMRDGEITQKGGGKPVKFNETLEPEAV